MNRPGGVLKETLKAMAAVATIRLAFRIALAAIVALVLAFMVWRGG